MRIDFYTKAVLTVIAISLAAIASQNLLTPAYAQNNGQPVKVIICDPAAPKYCADVSISGALKVER